MNLRSLVTCGSVCAVLVLAGCDQGRQAPGKVTVRVVNVAPSFAQLDYRREQTSPQSFQFKSGQEFSYDADTYDFYVTAQLLDPNVPAETWTFAPQLEEDISYTFVLTEAAGAVVPVVLEHPPAPANDAQILALHAGESLPAIDLYLERPGVGIAGATPRGSFAFQGKVAPRTLASGEYELWLTAAGDPANVLLATNTFTLPAATTTLFIVTPEADEGTAPLSVTVVQAAVGVLFDRNATSEMRVINAAADTQPRDVVIDQQFSPPAFPAVPFAAPTGYATVPVGARQVNVTPVGNPGVLELNQSLTMIGGVRHTVLVAGDAGVLGSAIVNDDGRRIRGEGKVRFFNAATQFGSSFLEFVAVPRGADPAQFLATALLAAPGGSALTPFPPGDYDLYVRNPTTASNLSGPTPFHIDERGLYGVLAVNGPDTATATVVLLDDFL